MLEERNVHCTILTPHCRPMSVGPYLKISAPNPRNSDVYSQFVSNPYMSLSYLEEAKAMDFWR